MDCFVLDCSKNDQNTLAHKDSIALEGMIALEDSIMLKNQPVTAGSKMLENFISPINASVIDRIVGIYNFAGKTRMDEFGIPNLLSQQTDQALGTNVSQQTDQASGSNVSQQTDQASGSNVSQQIDHLSGAIAALVSDAASFSLCNDLFGTYRKQAAENNCCYIHPSYGTVSRYGLIPLASSMDQIGIACKDLSEGFKLLSHIAGNDKNDAAMFPEESYDYTSSEKELTIAIPDSVVSQADDSTQAALADFAKNFSTTSIELAHFDKYKQAMYILSCAEISNNISRYDGINFGYRASDYSNIDELYVNTRTEGLGSQAKLTAIMGAYVLAHDKYISYYEKSMRLRRLIKDSLTFDGYDIIALPCKISELPYDNLALYSIANLAGLPSISFSYKGQAIQLISNVKKENSLLKAWEVCTK